MKTDVKKIDKLKRQMRVEAQSSEFEKEKNELYAECAKHLKVPGFRPGAAPQEILERHHSGYLREKLLEKLLPILYQRALESESLVPAAMPRISDVTLNAQGLSFSAEFETQPHIDIKDTVYKGIKLKSTDTKVTEEEIQKALNSTRDDISQFIKDADDTALARAAAYPSIDEFKKAIAGQLYLEKLKVRRQKIETQIRTHLLKSCKFDIPQAQVEQHHKELVNRELYRLRLEGISQEDLEKYKSDIETKLQAAAQDDVKLFYILEAIARTEGIALNDNVSGAVFAFMLRHAEYQE